MIASLVVLKNGYTWAEVATSGKIAFATLVTPVLVLLSVGALIGTWNLSGTIPTLAFYGIKLLRPGYFYVAAFVVCAVISISVGSAWATAGTIGVGLVGLASLEGVSAPMTAGAVISGAYVGDELSPLSETTVLTSQLGGIDLFTHLRSQVWTSGPAFAIAFIAFALLGWLAPVASGVDTDSELRKIDQLFRITPWNLLPLIVLIILSIRKVPTALAIMLSALLAGLMAPLLQRPAMLRFINDHTVTAPYADIKAVWLALGTGYEAHSGIPVLDRLLSRGGMEGMLHTLWIIIGAVSFGTLLGEFKLLTKLLNPLLARAHTTGRLIGSVVAADFGLNVLAGDQHVALVLHAQLFRDEFRKRGIQPQILTRASADGGSVTSALVPWNSCGAYLAATLGVPTLSFVPFCIFNIASPLLSVLWGVTGFTVNRVSASDATTERRPRA